MERRRRDRNASPSRSDVGLHCVGASAQRIAVATGSGLYRDARHPRESVHIARVGMDESGEVDYRAACLLAQMVGCDLGD
jgi:hypothetical protein